MPRLRIDLLEHVLKDGVLVAEELAGLAIDLPQHAGLADGEEVLLGADVDQHLLEHFVEIERLAGHVLDVPRQRAVLDAQRHRRRGVERRVRGLVAAAGRHPRLRLRDAPVGEIEIGIVAAGDPGVAAGARDVGHGAPGVAAGLAGARDGVELPQLLAGLGVVGADVAAILRPEPIAAVQPLDHLAARDDRTARIGEAAARVRDRHIPRHLAGARIERDQAAVVGRHVDLVAVDRDVAHRAEAANACWARPGSPRAARRSRRRTPASCCRCCRDT